MRFEKLASLLVQVISNLQILEHILVDACEECIGAVVVVVEFVRLQIDQRGDRVDVGQGLFAEISFYYFWVVHPTLRSGEFSGK